MSRLPSYPAPGDLLPHQPPMLLLRAVLGHDSGETCCEAGFDERFCAAGDGVEAAFGLELIAQAAAVHHALCQLVEREGHTRATRGLLLGSRKLNLAVRTLPVNEPLKVTVTGGQEPPSPGGLIRFEGRVETHQGQLLVSGDATVLEWRPDVQVA